jgi:two-component system, OmpR family, sensor histidine kinase VicK
LVRLVNNVLDLQRIESGDVTMAKQACNVAELMTQAIEAMQPMAQQHGITLRTEPVKTQIWADADYMLQALTNLLSNAIKFSLAGGEVWLTVESILQSDPSEIGSKTEPALSPLKGKKRKRKTPQLSDQPEEVLFQVRDQGQGIPAAKLESIFERFQQVDSSDSRKKGGTGLGLTICRKIIAQHDGRIWAESQLGQGSTFCFAIPAFKGRSVDL